MRYLALILALALFSWLMPPTNASASGECIHTWDAPQSKGTSDGYQIVVDTIIQGCTFHYTNYVGLDGARLYSPDASIRKAEVNWGQNYCTYAGREDTRRAYAYLWNIVVDPESIPVTCRRL